MNHWGFEAGQKINRLITGSVLLLFDINNSTDLLYFELFLRRANLDSKVDDIKNIFFVPYSAVDVSDIYTGQFEYDVSGQTPIVATYKRVLNTNSPAIENISFAKPLSFTGYTPKNKKLFVYPYNYIYISNNNGENNILKIENFDGNNITFRNEFAITVGGSGRLVPLNYRSLSEDIDNSINLGKLPTFEWSKDSYINWLTQNAVNNEINLINSFINSASQVAGGNITGGITSISSQIMNSYKAFYEAKLLPNKVAGTNTGDVSFSNAETNYIIQRLRPKNEYLRQIDDFFSRFGYKINELKVPNISGRANWNYVEIGEGENCAYASGNNQNGQVPQRDLDIINSQLREGLTIWGNPENIGNFNLSNGIV